MSTYESPGTFTGGRTAEEGGFNVVFDILGTNPEFRKIFKCTFYVGGDATQVVNLAYPAYASVPATDAEHKDGIVVTALLTEGDHVSRVTIPRCSREEFATVDSGWVVLEEDQTSMAKAFSLWPHADVQFDGVITRTIAIKNSAFTNNVPIEIAYQAFYKDVVDSDRFRTENGPSYTRELGQYILDRLNDLDARTDVSLRNYFGNTSNTSDILDEDLTAEKIENWVEAELHTVDTSTGKTLLAPAKGSFYPGVKNTNPASSKRDTSFKMYLYKLEAGTITQDVINDLSKVGWLFQYVVNSASVYIVATEEKFLSNAVYYISDSNGDFVKITNYTVGATLNDYRARYSCEIYTTKRIPFDPSKQMDFAINDTSAVITSKRSVVLTADNIAKYLNYSGTFVDIGGVTSGEANGTRLLVNGTDYVFADVNQAKTERTYTTQAVYDHVRILTDLTTDVDHRVGISYQAFGGQVMPGDVRNIRQDLTNILSIIAGHHLLTSENLAKSGIISQIVERLRRMETYHNHYMQVDHVIPLGLKGSGFQWFTIAQLADANWMNGPNALRDIGTFRVSSRKQGWTFEFVVTVDLNAKGDNRFAVRVLSAVGTEHAGIDDFLALAKKEVVGVRILWDENTKTTSGALLQIGFDCDKYVFDIRTDFDNNDTLTVTNKSGNTSSFELFYNPIETTQPSENYINVYGREQYTQVINKTVTDTSIPYYKHVVEYLYYKSNSQYALDGVDYFTYNVDSNLYEKASIMSGTKLDELGYDVYERTVNHGNWARVTVVAGQYITESDKLFVVSTESADSVSCTLPDGITNWGEANDGCESITRLLQFEDGGTVVWAGSAPMSYFSPGPNENGRDLTLHLSLIEVVQKYIDVASIRSIDMAFYDRKENRYFTKNIPMFFDELSSIPRITGDSLFYFQDLCGVILDMHRRPDKYSETSMFLHGKTYYCLIDGKFARYYPEDETVWLNEGGEWIAHEGGALGLTTNDVINSRRHTGELGSAETVQFYVPGELIELNVDTLLGTQSYINQRFDLRQVRIHF